jgi:hypothetical protein
MVLETGKFKLEGPNLAKVSHVHNREREREPNSFLQQYDSVILCTAYMI